MSKDKNDSDADARELVRLLRQYKLPAKVNLIPFNPWPGTDYECSTPERIRRFSDIVFEGGISAPVRTPRGRDIMAACGQLKRSEEHTSELQSLMRISYAVFCLKKKKNKKNHNKQKIYEEQKM